MRLTSHFTLAEVEHSETASRFGISNVVPQEMYLTILNTSEGMERVRQSLGNRPISINSWYRSLPLNRRIGSHDSSQHPKGEAVDFICPAFGTPTAICKSLVALREFILFDQLILEHTWVHISFNSIPNAKQRGQVLSLLKSGKYAAGLTDKEGNSV